jgi:putative transposase
MKAWLRTQGYEVSRKRVDRLMRKMALMAINPKPRLSFNGTEYKVYPYLLKGFSIDAPDMAWSTDITYIRHAHEFADIRPLPVTHIG